MGKDRRGPCKNIRMGIAQPGTFALAQGMVPTTLSGSGRGKGHDFEFLKTKIIAHKETRDPYTPKN